MKAIKPAVIAFLLWLLFFASNAFAVCRSPYPPKAYPPDQITVVSGGYEEHGLGAANQPK
jgi:hypothetical protein